jgi:hypothetical protein
MAKCPSNPPPPAGYSVWTGAVPAPLETWAIRTLKDIGKVPYGYYGWTLPEEELQKYPAPPILRKDRHTWSHRNGRLITGICIPGLTLYKPIAAKVGAGETLILDPATASPSSGIAVFDPPVTDWGLVLTGGAAITLVTAGFLFVLKRSPNRKRLAA